MITQDITLKYRDTLNSALDLRDEIRVFDMSSTQKKVVFQLYNAFLRLVEDYFDHENSLSALVLAQAATETCAHLRLSYRTKDYAYLRQWRYFHDLHRKMTEYQESSEPCVQKLSTELRDRSEDVVEILSVIESMIPLKELKKQYATTERVLSETGLLEVYNFLFHNLSAQIHSEEYPLETICSVESHEVLNEFIIAVLAEERDAVRDFFFRAVKA